MCVVICCSQDRCLLLISGIKELNHYSATRALNLRTTSLHYKKFSSKPHYICIQMQVQYKQLQPVPNVLHVTILFSTTREMIIETLISPVLDMMNEPFHQVLQFSTIYLMRQSQPFASIIVVPMSAICENRLLPNLFLSSLKN
jgi:hypothetical protein